MRKHPRLMKRGSMFYHRAQLPEDIRVTYGKSEETFSLKTRDPMEALRLVRQTAADVDRGFAKHRLSLQNGSAAGSHGSSRVR